jgi:hypothetical protein
MLRGPPAAHRSERRQKGQQLALRVGVEVKKEKLK